MTCGSPFADEALIQGYAHARSISIFGCVSVSTVSEGLSVKRSTENARGGIIHHVNHEIENKHGLICGADVMSSP
jgi:hypothetical protein